MAWDTRELQRIQEKLRERLVLEDGFSQIKSVGGADVHFRGDLAYCAITILSCPDLEVLEVKTTRSSVQFPYIPTFLSFREAEPMIKTFGVIEQRPDVLLIDGQGIAHPRGVGLASHVGAIIDHPTIGVAKRPLVGEFRSPVKVGGAEVIGYKGREVGYVFLSKKGTRPIFVSPGHRVSVETSLDIVKKCVKHHKLPEPLRLAHLRAREAIRSEETSSVSPR